MSPEPSGDPLRLAIHALLSADSTLAALLSSPEAVKHRYAAGVAPPYLIFQAQAPGVPVRTFGASSDQSVWLVKGVCRGNSAAAAEDIDARCQELLDEAQFTVSGSTVTCLREGGVDYADPGDGEPWHHRGSLYRIYT